MKHKFRITRDYKRCSNAAFLVRATNVYNSMNGHVLFPQPPVALEALKQQLDLLETAMVDAQHRDRLKAAQKNGIIVQVKGMLDQLADYVTTVANGDEAILLAAGFAVSGSANVTAYEAVENFTVKAGPGSGQVIADVKRIPGSIYVLYYGIDNGASTVWQHVFSRRKRFSLAGLQPGQVYAFQMKIGIDTDHEIASVILTKMVA